MLVEGAISSQGAVEDSSGAGFETLRIEISANVCLVEGGDDFVAGLETRDLLADGYDCACAIGSWDDVFPLPMGILSSSKGEVTIL